MSGYGTRIQLPTSGHPEEVSLTWSSPAALRLQPVVKARTLKQRPSPAASVEAALRLLRPEEARASVLLEHPAHPAWQVQVSGRGAM